MHARRIERPPVVRDVVVCVPQRPLQPPQLQGLELVLGRGLDGLEVVRRRREVLHVASSQQAQASLPDRTFGHMLPSCREWTQPPTQHRQRPAESPWLRQRTSRQAHAATRLLWPTSIQADLTTRRLQPMPLPAERATRSLPPTPPPAERATPSLPPTPPP